MGIRYDNGTNVRISSNIQSLLDYENPPTLVGRYGFLAMFNTCPTIVDASTLLLPATTLSAYCYSYLFVECSSLVSISFELPSLSLSNGCYLCMFQNCF